MLPRQRALGPLVLSARPAKPRWLLKSAPRSLPFPPSLVLKRAYSYPKEGVFQPNSPPRDPRSFVQSHPSPLQQPPPPPPKGSSWRPRWWSVMGAVFCVGLGFFGVRATLARLVFESPEPGSPEDVEELTALGEELDEIPLVQQLREAWQLDHEGRKVPVWREWTAYQGLSKIDSRRASRLTTGPLRGSAGVQAQRVFWNDNEKLLCLFINFGTGTSGWPGVVHGGAIATICDEALGRVAIRKSAEKTAVTANLEVNYLEKVEPGMWYVLMAGLDSDRESTDRKFYVQGILACVGDAGPNKDGDELTGIHPHAVAKGLFVVPKGVKLNAIEEDF